MYHEMLSDWSSREDFPLVSPPRPTIRRSNGPCGRERCHHASIEEERGHFLITCSCGLLVARRETREAAREVKRLHEGYHDNYDE